MNTPRERILLVESDPEISDLIARQTLQPLGYRVQIIGAAAPAIQEAIRFAPDVIIANMSLPGLSGKDLLVALSSQGLDVPVIVIAEEGMEETVIQAFRLGASDYLIWPMREAEVVSAVERVLKQLRGQLDREKLARQVEQTNKELQHRVRELTTIFAIGKAVTSITDQRKLLAKIIEGATYVAEADSGWLLMRDERGKSFILSACRNLPKTITSQINKPWDDGISSLVALSGEPLSIHGDPLKRFKVARLGKAVLVMPVKAKKQVIGLLVVVRKAANPFTASSQALVEAVADYASIALVNVRLFKLMEERVRALQKEAASSKAGEQAKSAHLMEACKKTQELLTDAVAHLDMLANGKVGKLDAKQIDILDSARENLTSVAELIEKV